MCGWNQKQNLKEHLEVERASLGNADLRSLQTDRVSRS